MSDTQSQREIDDEAAAWAIRADVHGLDEAQDPELAAWLAGNPRRSGALLRAQAALSFLGRGRALAGFEPAPSAAQTRRRLLIGGGVAGAIAAGLGGAAVLAARPERYDTVLGEVRRVPLKDGSLITINTATTLYVSLRAGGREVRLRKGEAWFEVAKDAERPFLVEAGLARIRAVGTAFSVRKLGADCEVLVTEGVVEAWLDGHGAAAVQAPAGSKLLLKAGRAVQAAEAAAEIERSLAWRSGQIVLDGETLEQAAAQFNRYNARPLIIEDPTLAQERFVGLFRTNEPESFAAAVAATLGARVSRDADAIRLRRLS